MSPRLRSLLPAALAVGLACSSAFFAAKDEERFALDLLRLVRQARTEDALALTEPSLRTAPTRSALEEVERSLPPGEPTRIDTVGSYLFTNVTTGERTANLTFQLEYPSTWLLANVLVRRVGSDLAVRRFQVTRLRDSLQHLNAFTLRGKGLRQLAFLAVAAAAFAASVAAVVVCARSRIRRKLLWLLLSGLGAGQVLINWTTGATDTRSVSVQLLSVGMQRANEYAPWVLSISLPIGAILFFGFRRKLTLQPPAIEPPAPPAT